MEQHNGLPKDFSMEKAMAFLNTPAGKQLAQMLQSTRDPGLEAAAAQAAAGNMDAARESAKQLLSDPKVRELLSSFGGGNGRN